MHTMKASLTAAAERLQATLFCSGVHATVTYFHPDYCAVRLDGDSHLTQLEDGMPAGFGLDYVEQEPGFPVIAYYQKNA